LNKLELEKKLLRGFLSNFYGFNINHVVNSLMKRAIIENLTKEEQARVITENLTSSLIFNWRELFTIDDCKHLGVDVDELLKKEQKKEFNEEEFLKFLRIENPFPKDEDGNPILN